MRSKWPLLLLCSEEGIETLVRSALPPDAAIAVMSELAAAQRRLEEEVFSGLVVELRAGPPGGAESLAVNYLARQGTGRVAVLAREPGQLTLLRLNVRDPRVSLLFHPWDADELAAALRVPNRSRS